MAAAHLDCVCPGLVDGCQHSQQLGAHLSIVPVLGAPASQLGAGPAPEAAAGPGSAAECLWPLRAAPCAAPAGHCDP